MYIYRKIVPVVPLGGLASLAQQVKIIKNEVGCRDDTVSKTVETRRYCEED